MRKKAIAERNRQMAILEQDHHKLKIRKERERAEAKRQMQLKLMKEQKEERKGMLQQKFEADDIHLKHLQIKKDRELAISKEKRELIQQLKQDNVLRIKRAQDYKARRVLEKIQDDDERTKELTNRKNEIAMHRKKASIEAKRQKDMLVDLLEKTQGTNSMQKITAVLSGKPLSNQKVRRKVERCSDTVLKPAPSGMIKPEAPTLVKRLSSTQEEKERQRYKSPYEH